MKLIFVNLRLLLVISAVILLSSCGRSKQSQYYILTPLPCNPYQAKTVYSGLKIAINKLNIPGYLDKPQLSIHCSPNQIHLEENHQWAETLKDNMLRVLQTNLVTLLPGAQVEKEPLHIKFQPNYTIQVNISQFKYDMYGNSQLRADYVIYHGKKTIKKQSVCYQANSKTVSFQEMVMSLNCHLSRLSKEIAGFFHTNNKAAHTQKYIK